jgi:opacity protein-like surface antigen
MHLKPYRAVVVCLLAAFSAPAWPQESPPEPVAGGIELDVLFGYYDQDGEHSAVTGGTGTEEQTVLSPLILVGWSVNDDWTLRADLGVDQVTSASVDAMDDNVSSASRVDERAFTNVTATRRSGSSQYSFTLGLSNEYDYRSVSAGVGWSLDLNQKNTTLAASLRHYADVVELYDIDGVQRGDDDRQTTDVTLGLTQVLGRRTLGTLELEATLQSGLLSTPFHEVVLANGERLTERLPDERTRWALGVGLSHAFRRNVVQKLAYRYYTDDWGIAAHSISAETHFRLPLATETWIYPLLRYHTQTAADYFRPTGLFAGGEDFFTSDWDLAEVTTERYGLGLRGLAPAGKSWWLGIRRYEARFTFFSRDDGLEGLSASFGFGWSL